MSTNEKGPQPGSQRTLSKTSIANSILHRSNRNRAPEIISSVQISQVWRALGGGELRHGHGRAFWRGGDNPQAVSLNDDLGVWFDHVEGKGGGVLDLVQLVQGSRRGEALRWVADLAGIPLDERQFTPLERHQYAQQQSEFQRDLCQARLFRRTALSVCEELLTELKATLFSTVNSESLTDLPAIEQLAAALRRANDDEVVAEYRWWLANHATITSAMVAAGRDREEAERRALRRFVEGLGEVCNGAD